MSWGIKITILYVGFVVMIGTMVFLTMRQNVDLVSADYYQQELDYQQKLDRMNASNTLAGKPEVRPGKEFVSISFPAEMRGKKISGRVNFFRPADAARDFNLEISTDSSGAQQIPANKFVSGMYTVQISWTAGEKKYYNESPLYIP